mmetsp:Transcript_48284/g.73008  ORF Transcript_48284/g.73008 Transcript_48284/m.73008 type:complete len:558 (+) Transcript_48284:234-1907(+)
MEQDQHNVPIFRKKMILPRFFTTCSNFHKQHHPSPPPTTTFPSSYQQQQKPTLFLLGLQQQKDKFISWVSIFLLVVLFLCLRSISMPYLHKMAEFRKAATQKSSTTTTTSTSTSSSSTQSFYLTLTGWVYLWMTSVTCLTIIPHFSSHYNEIIAASLFFPCWILTVSTLMVGRCIIRGCYYCLGGCRKMRVGRRRSVDSDDDEEEEKDKREKQVNADPQIITKMKEQETKLHTNPKSKNFKDDDNKNNNKGKLIAFHRPFRKTLKSSAFISTSLCFLYMHCWSRTLGAFKVHEMKHDAGAVCRAVFRPIMIFLDGGVFVTTAAAHGEGDDDDVGEMEEEEDGADESLIWFIWVIIVLGMLFAYAQDEFAHRHYYGSCYYYTSTTTTTTTQGVLRRLGGGGEESKQTQRQQQKQHSSSHGKHHLDETFDDLTDLNDSLYDIDDDHEEEEDDEEEYQQQQQQCQEGGGGAEEGKGMIRNRILEMRKEKERPLGTLEMCPWYNVVLVSTIFDILIQWKIFLGRFDARSMQPALQQIPPKKKKKNKNTKIFLNDKKRSRMQ